jgi:hypothetical protein
MVADSKTRAMVSACVTVDRLRCFLAPALRAVHCGLITDAACCCSTRRSSVRTRCASRSANTLQESHSRSVCRRHSRTLLRCCVARTPRSAVMTVSVIVAFDALAGGEWGAPCAVRQAVQDLVRCHEEHNIAKFWGACNDYKQALDICFRVGPSRAASLSLSLALALTLTLTLTSLSLSLSTRISRSSTSLLLFSPSHLIYGVRREKRSYG